MECVCREGAPDRLIPSIEASDRHPSVSVTGGPASPEALKPNIHLYYGNNADSEDELHHHESDGKGGLKEVS
jgi:hypothetical protein